MIVAGPSRRLLLPTMPSMPEGFAYSRARFEELIDDALSFAKQIGDIGAIMIAILVAVFFTILLVVANTMAQSVRERTSELAVLKTLGFSNAAVLALVLAESIFVALLGGSLGLALAWAIVQHGDPTGGQLPAFVLPNRDLGTGGLLMVLLGLFAGALPAAQAMRLRITDALRRN